MLFILAFHGLRLPCAVSVFGRSWRRMWSVVWVALALLTGFSGPLQAASLDADTQAEQAFADALTAVQEGELARAELLLERALMLNPEHAAARLELAGLMAARRRNDAAHALILTLIEDPRTPEAHRTRLRSMLANLGGEALDDQPSTTVLAEVFAGRMHNPLARAAIPELTLTFPDGPVSLPVDQNIRPASVFGTSVRRTVAGQSSLEASVQTLSSGGQAYRLGAMGRIPVSGLGQESLVQWSAQTQQAFSGNTRHAYGLVLSRASWALAGGGFNEPALGRHGAYLRADRLIPLRSNLVVNGFVEAEYAANGPPSLWRAGGAAAWTPAAGWFLLGQADLVRDTSGYSALLANDAHRRMHGFSAAVERALTPDGVKWQLFLRGYVARRWSNLDLFDYRDFGAQVSLRRRW